MKLSVIALDYDGTIARNDAVGQPVRDAIAAARAAGIVVLLVTGRVLGELRRVAGDLHVVDGVIAENGALVHFPDSGYTSAISPLVPDILLRELVRRGIPFQAGQCLVDAAANEAPRLLEAIRALELPLVLVFNGGRVMVMPQGVSKATGLREALETRRLSARNTLAIGDAENDHELLRLAEVGVAVEWGSAQLRSAADIVLSGSGPEAVADYLRSLAETARLPVPPRARRRLLLGYTEDGREFSLAVRGRNVLVAGDAKSGKSWAAGLLCEQLILQGYSVCVLESGRRLSVAGGFAPRHGDRRRGPSAHTARAAAGAAVSGSERRDRPLALPSGRKTRLHPGGAAGLERHAATYRPSASDSRRRGALFPARFRRERSPRPEGEWLYTVVTYCASRLPRALLAATEVMIVTCESNPAEIEALRQRCTTCQGVSTAQWSMLGHLRTGQAIALPVTEEAEGQLRRFTMATRLTPHVRHREKYVDVPVTERQAFVFNPNGHPSVHRARTLRQFVLELESAPSRALDMYLRRGDFSRWIGDVFGDHALAAELRDLEDRHRTSPRKETVPEIVGAIRSRYDLLADEPIAVDASQNEHYR